MKEKIKLVWRKIDELIPYEHNAKLHPQEQLDRLVGSFDEFGRIVPAGIDKDGNLIYGHGRILAARQRGDTDFPCIEIDGLSDVQRRAFVHADNLLAESPTDADVLRREMQALAAAGFDVSITGFDPEGIRIGDEDKAEPQPEAHEDDYDKEPPEEPRTKRGQLWQLGEHRLMCGDATSAEDVDKLLNGEFARLTVTSPPYGVGKDYEEKGISGCLSTISGVIQAIKGKSLIIGWNVDDLAATGTQFTEPTAAYSISMMADAGYGLLYTRIWQKPGGNFAGNNPYYTVTTKPVQDYEYLLAFAEKNADRHLASLKDYLFNEAAKASITDQIVKSIGGPQFMCKHWFTNHQWSFIDAANYARLRQYCVNKDIPAFQRSYDDLRNEYLENTVFSHCLSSTDFSEWGLYGVWSFNTVHKRLGGHAAAFPVELPARYIKMHSYPGSVVLDPFGGTGTTLIACEQLGRRCRMMEIDPHYCDVIIDRWETFTGKKAVLLNGEG